MYGQPKGWLTSGAFYSPDWSHSKQRRDSFIRGDCKHFYRTDERDPTGCRGAHHGGVSCQLLFSDSDVIPITISYSACSVKAEMTLKDDTTRKFPKMNKFTGFLFSITSFNWSDHVLVAGLRQPPWAWQVRAFQAPPLPWCSSYWMRSKCQRMTSGSSSQLTGLCKSKFKKLMKKFRNITFFLERRVIILMMTKEIELIEIEENQTTWKWEVY